MLTRKTNEAQPISAAARRYAMLMLALVYMFNFIDRQILSILLPAIRQEFQVPDAMLGFLSGTAFVLFYVTLGIPVAMLADRSNRRNLIAIALAIWSGMTMLSGLVVNFWQLTLARIGVGIGEAGCSPPAHSMIADFYPPEQRSTAMGIYTLGISAGIMLAYLAGGWIADTIGWRAAFLIVGAPGLLLALLLRITVVEPARGASEQRRDEKGAPPLRQTLRYLIQRRSYLYMAVAAGLVSIAGYSIGIFFPSFMARSFGMSLAEIGVWVGLIFGIAGGAGFFIGGYLADRAGSGAQNRSMRFIAWMMLLTAVLHALTFLAATPMHALLIFILPAATSNFYLAPVLAAAQTLVELRMRAVASAVMLFVINAVGLGIGPWLVGLLSDLLEPRYGSESMRYSLLIVSSIVLPLAAALLALAGRHADRDRQYPPSS